MNPHNVHNSLATSLGELREFADRDRLESPEAYRAALESVLEVLNKEDGLIQLQDLPTIVIPERKEHLMKQFQTVEKLDKSAFTTSASLPPVPVTTTSVVSKLSVNWYRAPTFVAGSTSWKTVWNAPPAATSNP